MAQRATIATDEASNVAKTSVFHVWAELLNLADNWSADALMEGVNFVTTTQPSTVAYGYGLSPTSLTFNGGRLQNAAADWEKILRAYQGASVVLMSATRAVPPQFPIFRLHDADIINFCARRNVFFDSMTYYSAILRQFDNVQAVRVEIARDHEIEGADRLRFRVMLADEIAKIVAEEDRFAEYIQQIFPPDTLSNFTITLEIADAGQRFSGSSL
jgi:hypothetical protein